MSATNRKITDTLVLGMRNVNIPQLGLGTYLSPPNRTLNSCLAALQAGYRQIDTGQYYENEEEVGRAIHQSGIPRDQVFVTTKILTPGETVEDNYASCLESVQRIGGRGEDSYVDCFLIHSPSPGSKKRREMWLALERLYEEGKVRAIGTSNFGIGQIEDLKGVGKVWPPHVNQIELHPWTQQKEIVQYCQDNGIVIQAYCPIVRNKKADDEHLLSLAKKHNVTPNQVLIRWSIQKGWVSLPKSDSPERIQLNRDIYDFDLDDEDMALLNGLDQGSDGALVMTVDNS
ncbi:hypothetical protein M406DRAFT_60296 [Cryphonectria parasitica EP155]|uniref:NADP-dependent oxidoreductase domain-containing protein n=1 Tax=Cryphonectria parasitica (strain ATCC 38755 / EP155) TaxID=660469 RepID=A0A9P5CPX3_CRYP1|nr:uncharacterized protein M406DRAFT_60296 [Cryphonectria parasitica EP155]KAF3765636.1 hypothetical protein M406DRAFT_60296 [Cryphonectria parasitica EP155]